MSTYVRRQTTLTFVVLVVLLAIAIAIDSIVVQRHLPLLHSALSVKASMDVGSVVVKGPPVSVAVLLVVSLCGLALTLLPYKELAHGTAWRHFLWAFSRAIWTAALLAVVPLLLDFTVRVFGQGAFDGLRGVASADVVFASGSLEFLTLKYTLLGLVAALSGVGLWTWQGLAKAIGIIDELRQPFDTSRARDSRVSNENRR